jgi:hypothetical protein
MLDSVIAVMDSGINERNTCEDRRLMFTDGIPPSSAPFVGDSRHCRYDLENPPFI